MQNEVAVRQSTVPVELQEKVLLGGDLSKLTPQERLSYYNSVCSSVGLNPLTRPFEYIVLNDRLVLYARKDCTDQLRELHGISIEIASREVIDGVCVVTARAKNMTERIDESVGAVPFMKEEGEWKRSAAGKSYFETTGKLLPLGLEARSNAMMKAETKAKRRVTLSICGLGVMDESEIEAVADAKKVRIDVEDKPLPKGAEMLAKIEARDTVQGEVSRNQASNDMPSQASSNQDAPAPIIPNQLHYPVPPKETLFEEASAVADYEAVIADGDSTEDLQKTWDEIVKDKRIATADRTKLYQQYQRKAKQFKGR